jgi:hypothetical protein
MAAAANSKIVRKRPIPSYEEVILALLVDMRDIMRENNLILKQNTLLLQSLEDKGRKIALGVNGY